MQRKASFSLPADKLEALLAKNVSSRDIMRIVVRCLALIDRHVASTALEAEAATLILAPHTLVELQHIGTRCVHHELVEEQAVCEQSGCSQRAVLAVVAVENDKNDSSPESLKTLPPELQPKVPHHVPEHFRLAVHHLEWVHI